MSLEILEFVVVEDSEDKNDSEDGTAQLVMKRNNPTRRIFLSICATPLNP